jgi:hypothetical protein
VRYLSLAAFVTALALVSASGATPASAARHAGAVTLTVKSAKFDARWHASKMSGRIVVSGTASAKMQVTVGWFPEQLIKGSTPNFGPTGPATGSFAVGKGKFTKSIPARGLFPGRFVLAGYGKTGSTIVSIPGRVIVLAAPREGVVGKAYVSKTSNGPPVTRVPAGSKAIYAHYTWAVYPQRSDYTITWTGPGGNSGWDFTGRLVSRGFVSIVKANKGKKLRSGTWHNIVRAFGRPVAELTVRVG